MKYEIEKFGPCTEAIEFRAKFDSFEDAWNACERGDWMLWIASKLKVDKRTLTLAKGKCAATVLHLMKDKRSKKAVEVAIAYGEGDANDEDLMAAAAAAAAVAADDDAAYAAAYAAADAAAYAAADVAAAYAAAAAAADAAAYAAAYTAKVENQKEIAKICRSILTDAVFEKIKQEKK